MILNDKKRKSHALVIGLEGVGKSLLIKRISSNLFIIAIALVINKSQETVSSEANDIEFIL